MSTINILCGHLPNTNSMRCHPIQNIKLFPSQTWSRAEIIYTDNMGKSNTIYTIGNIMNQDYNINMASSRNKSVVLSVNNKLVKEDTYLFFVEIKIHMNDENPTSDFIKYIESTIYD